MREISEALVEEGRGIVGDLPSSPKRAVTLLSAEQWEDVTGELGADLPWHTRRANVLVSCGSLAHLLGRTIEIGTARLEVLKETRPCELMDRQHEGLRRALERDCRGGVHGRVVRSGGFKVGDVVIVDGWRRSLETIHGPPASGYNP